MPQLWKETFWEASSKTSGCYGCGKNDHKVGDYPTLYTRGREAKQDPLNGPNLDDQKKTHFYALKAKEEKEANIDGGTGN